MKIVLEENDITEIVASHVKAQDILGLGSKPFDVQLEISGEEVTASIVTDISATTSVTPEPVKKTRKRRTKAQIAADEAAATEAEAEVTSEAEPEAETEDSIESMEPEQPESVEADSEPPFQADPAVAASAAANPGKSLFT